MPEAAAHHPGRRRCVDFGGCHRKGALHDCHDRTRSRLCRPRTRLATFWSEALGYTTAGDAGNYVLLVPTESGPPKLLLQAVTEAKATKNRMHLDIETPDVDAEVIRLESLGARRLETDGAVRARFALGDHGRPGRQRVLRLQR